MTYKTREYLQTLGEREILKSISLTVEQEISLVTADPTAAGTGNRPANSVDNA